MIAPLPAAQLVESRIINILQLHTMVASKAARCVLAAPATDPGAPPGACGRPELPPCRSRGSWTG